MTDGFECWNHRYNLAWTLCRYTQNVPWYPILLDVDGEIECIHHVVLLFFKITSHCRQIFSLEMREYPYKTSKGLRTWHNCKLLNSRFNSYSLGQFFCLFKRRMWRMFASVLFIGISLSEFLCFRADKFVPIFQPPPTNSRSRVRARGDHSTEFTRRIGVQQGHLFSPFTFNFVTEMIIEAASSL